MSVNLLARTLRGVEWAAADEIAGTLPTAAPAMAPREVRFRLPELTPHVLDLRTVDDVFLVLARAADPGHTKDVVPKLGAWAGRLPWDAALSSLARVRTLPRRPRLDVVASLGGRRNYNRYDVEDAVGAAVAPRLGGTYQSRRPTAGSAPEMRPVDLSVRVFLDGHGAVAALRVGSRPVHRRDYKAATGPGTLHPPLAAVLARLAAPARDDVVLDPFCGDGTIAIETALAQPAAHVVARDLDPERVENTRKNAARAGVRLDAGQLDAGMTEAPSGGVAVLATNPPWNLAVDASGTLAPSLWPFWERVPGLLAPGGRLCVVSDNESQTAEALRELGYAVGLAVQLRVAGRLARLLLAAPPGAPAPGVPAGPERWRRAALAAGLVGDESF
jgi:23S rRNA G2445 N2-methylase RlmL